MLRTKKNRVRKCTKYIKTLSRKENWGRVLIFLFFLIISAGFWLLQSLQQVIDANFRLPIAYVNKSDRIVVKDSLPEFLTVKVLDKGITLLGYSFTTKERVIKIDLTPLTNAGSVYTVPAQHIETECLKVLPPSSKLVSYSPTHIAIRPLPLKEKTVPVFFRGSIVPANGFMLTEKVRLFPSEITVYGTEQELDTLSGIYIQETKKENVNKSHSFRVKLSPPIHIKPKAPTVDLIVKVEECTEKTLEIPIVAKDFPAHYRLRTFPPAIQLFCRLPLSQYAAVDASHFEASVFYSETIKDSSSTVPVVMTKQPEWMNDHYRFTPEKVEYLIEEVRSYD